MEVAKTLVDDILQELLVSGSQQAVKSFDFNVAVRYLNRYMAQLDSDGVSLGYTEVSSASDPITVPAGGINAIIANVAMQLAARYDIEIDQTLVLRATEGYRTLLRLGVDVGESSYPSTLPLGSGNEYESTTNSRFYSGLSDDVSAENGSAIGVESGTDE